MMKKARILWIFLTMIASCNIFQTRDADPPEPPALWNAFPNTPERCLENLVYAFSFRENVFKYKDILSDDFIFYFDPQDVQDFTVPDRWFKQSEIDMLMNVYFQSDQTQDMNLSLEVLPNQPDIIQSNHAWLYREYILLVENTIPGFNNEFIGQFQLYLERESNGFWIIKEWIDYRTQSIWTFGRMKNAFGS